MDLYTYINLYYTYIPNVQHDLWPGPGNDYNMAVALLDALAVLHTPITKQHYMGSMHGLFSSQALSVGMDLI